MNSSRSFVQAGPSWSRLAAVYHILFVISSLLRSVHRSNSIGMVGMGYPSAGRITVSVHGNEHQIEIFLFFSD